MYQLWKEYSKESRQFWFFSMAGFLFLSGYMIYKLGIKQIHIQGISQVVLVAVFFFFFAQFIWEMYRQIKSWKNSQYRLLPISETKFYFSNILFSWLTSTIFLFSYYCCLVGLVFLLDHQVQMSHFQEYWKHLLIVSYFFLSASVYIQLVYLLSSGISMNAPNKLQKGSKYVLFVLLIGGEMTVSEQLLSGYRKLAFIKSHQFKITLGYIPLYLDDLVFDFVFVGICIVLSIFILKKYIEAERR
ncbi:hypothetical protein IGJ55_001271 [Enterococcus sp. AZ170]|uniref:hypothetical protein n=1 Tax=unclassified Enterococcus TaxID=2608891 RepID=UPI003D28F2B1